MMRITTYPEPICESCHYHKHHSSMPGILEGEHWCYAVPGGIRVRRTNPSCVHYAPIVETEDTESTTAVK